MALCEVCRARIAVMEVRDINASGPWVLVCSDKCGDKVVTHAVDCDCTNCNNERTEGLS